MLAKLNKIARQLASIDSVQDAVDLRNKATAIETYSKAVSDSKEIERSAIVIRLRCERRLGELLSKMTKPGRKRSHDATISDFGITKSASSRYQTVAKLPEQDFEEFLESARELSTNAVIKLVQERERESERYGPRSGHNVISGDMNCLWDLLDDNSVDMFFADPPYDKSGVDCYSRLAELAADKLKPGGLCLTYPGKLYLAEIMNCMSESLTYWWLFSIRTAGGSIVHARGIKETWKPILAFAKPPIPKANYLSDNLQGGGREKQFHIWQQSQSEVEYLIDRLTKVGDLIVDPFAGSGTTLAAAKKLNRNYLGCERDSGTAKMARRRLAA